MAEERATAGPEAVREVNFDGLVGPTHNYAGLSPGNIASAKSRGAVSNPRAAALQGLAKMRLLKDLGVEQALLPPHPRPHLPTLRACGFGGSDAEVLRRAAQDAPWLLVSAASASAMWTANAATVAPSADTLDGRVHLTPANLVQMLHRSLEPSTTERILRSIFADESSFAVHPALPPHPELGDEGAANHTRLRSSQGTVHLFGFGRSPDCSRLPHQYPARQTRLASESLARVNQLQAGLALFWQQHPEGIDRGAFHSDVLAVGHLDFLMLHELAFVELEPLLDQLRRRLGPALRVCLAREQELPIADAVAAYPFNSQIVTQPNGEMVIVAPAEAQANPPSAAYLARVVEEDNPVTSVIYVDVRQSMSNGGGPACLRLRVPLADSERQRIAARVFLDEALFEELSSWIERHYRDRLEPADLADVALLTETQTALDELTSLLRLGSVYDFQRG